MKRLRDVRNGGDAVVDADIHLEIPDVKALVPFMEGHWRDFFPERGIIDLQTANYPPLAPFSARQDWRRSGTKPAGSIAQVRSELLDRFTIDTAICNCLFGVQLLTGHDMATVVAKAANDYIAAEWLSNDPRLRASIVVPSQYPLSAVAEIDRCAQDKRFVQVLLLVSGEMPLGNRYNWPIFEAAARHGLPVVVHAGSNFRHPLTPVGGTQYYFHDYVSQASAFQAQLVSLVMEGVFSQYPTMKIVFAESGVTWLPGILTRLDKFWKGLRAETPWVHERPSEIVKRHIRFTLQPFDAPGSAAHVSRVLEHLGDDNLILFSSDYPHWQFDGDDVIPPGISDEFLHKMAVVNPKSIYGRI
jgi:predicted TIM-barrel fold metal-dependent hydrolase